MTLNYWTASWPLSPRTCPCDLHFFEYCRATGLRGKAIFHFGTGRHHYLGVKNMELDPPNHILGVTASREEHDAYIELIINNPVVANYYKVLFCDIYTMAPLTIPRFDLVSLFHLCEFYSARNRAYTSGDDWSVLSIFVEALNPGGSVLLYRGSNAYPAANALMSRMVDDGRLTRREDFESLAVYANDTHGGPA